MSIRLCHTIWFLCITLLLISTFTWAKDIPAAVAFKCGKPSLYLTPVGWMQDGEQPCLHREEDIVTYCQRIYNDSSLIRASFTSVIDINLPDWCHLNRSDCLPPFENRSVYPIQPWICSGPPSPQLTVPLNCSLKRIDDSHHKRYACHKTDFWMHAAQEACESNQTVLLSCMPIKPCIKVDSYTTMHYLGADIVCCLNPTSYTHERTTSAISLTNSLLGSADTNLIISNDERLYEKYLDSEGNQSEEQKSHRNQQYKSAKTAAKEAFMQRKTKLEDDFIAAEANLPSDDWLTNPERTQEAEDALHKEFFQKYMALDEEERKVQHRLDETHWKRVLQTMERHKQVVLDQWANITDQPNVNLSALKRATGRLLHTLENQRAHVIRRFARLQMKDASEALRNLPEVRQLLAELEHLLNNSLTRLDRYPAYKTAMLQYVQQLRTAHYAQTDASARAIAVMSDRSGLPEGVRLPSPSDQAALHANALIAQHTHRLLSRIDGKKSLSDEHQKSTSHASPLPKLSHVPEHGVSSPRTSFLPQLSVRNVPEEKHRVQSQPVVVSYPKSPDAHSAESTEDIVVEIHLPTPQPTPSASDATSTIDPARPEGLVQKRNKAQVIVPAIFVCAVFLLGVILIARCYVRRMRLQRAGYNLTVVEVDEVANMETTGHVPHLPRLVRGRSNVNGVGSSGAAVRSHLDHDPVDPLTRWQLNGYENPAYKFAEGGYNFSPGN